MSKSQKKLKEHRYASTYPPIESSPYELVFVNRTTTEKTLTKLNDAIINSELFTLDTESAIIPYQPNKPSLIQLQIITSEIFLIVVFIEVCRLPRRDQPTFPLIKKLFNAVFQPEKRSLFGVEYVNLLNSFNMIYSQGIKFIYRRTKMYRKHSEIIGSTIFLIN